MHERIALWFNEPDLFRAFRTEINMLKSGLHRPVSLILTSHILQTLDLNLLQQSSVCLTYMTGIPTVSTLSFATVNIIQTRSTIDFPYTNIRLKANYKIMPGIDDILNSFD